MRNRRQTAWPLAAALLTLAAADLPSPPGADDWKFDVLHRTFLGYPVSLAPTDRVNRFFKLYTDVVAAHGAMGAPKSRFTPAEAGWAAMCYGLIRHPEFHLY